MPGPEEDLSKTAMVGMIDIQQLIMLTCSLRDRHRAFLKHADLPSGEQLNKLFVGMMKTLCRAAVSCTEACCKNERSEALRQAREAHLPKLERVLNKLEKLVELERRQRMTAMRGRVQLPLQQLVERWSSDLTKTTAPSTPNRA